MNKIPEGSGSRPCSDAAPGLDDTAFLLNCYDVWSATPPGPLPCHAGEAPANDEADQADPVSSEA